jgi:hypothetical protein
MCSLKLSTTSSSSNSCSSPIPHSAQELIHDNSSSVSAVFALFSLSGASLQPPAQIKDLAHFSASSCPALDLFFSSQMLHQWLKTCLRTIFNCYFTSKISLNSALYIVTPLITTYLASPRPFCADNSQHELLTQQLNHASLAAQRAFRILQGESIQTQAEPDIGSSPPPTPHINSVKASTLAHSANSLPIYPDAAIYWRFPPVFLKLSNMHRETWANILRSIVTNESLRGEQTMIYRFENITKGNIFLICLSSHHCRSLRENLARVKFHISKAIENNSAWNRKTLTIDEGILAWVTEAQSIPLAASRTLITLPDRSWAWFAIYRSKPHKNGKRTRDEISK